VKEGGCVVRGGGGGGGWGGFVSVFENVSREVGGLQTAGGWGGGGCVGLVAGGRCADGVGH